MTHGAIGSTVPNPDSYCIGPRNVFAHGFMRFACWQRFQAIFFFGFRSRSLTRYYYPKTSQTARIPFAPRIHVPIHHSVRGIYPIAQTDCNQLCKYCIMWPGKRARCSVFDFSSRLHRQHKLKVKRIHQHQYS